MSVQVDLTELLDTEATITTMEALVESLEQAPPTEQSDVDRVRDLVVRLDAVWAKAERKLQVEAGNG